jgi:hypothetical protein
MKPGKRVDQARRAKEGYPTADIPQVWWQQAIQQPDNISHQTDADMTEGEDCPNPVNRETP